MNRINTTQQSAEINTAYFARRGPRWLRWALLLLLILFGLRQSALAATTTLAFQPSEIALVPNESAEIALNLVNGGNIYGAEIQVTYDAAIVAISGMDVGNCPEPGFVVTNSAQGDRATYAVTQLNPQVACDSGRVLTLHLTCLSEGSTTLDLADSLLSSPDGELLPYATSGGTVTCDATAVGPPQPTATPTTGVLAISPPEAFENSGVVTIDVQLQFVHDVYGADISLAFDPAALSVVDADPMIDGVQIAAGGCPAPGLAILNEVDNASGAIRYALTQVNPQPACTGGAVAHIEFACLGTAQSTVTITRSLLSNTVGAAVTHTTSSGIIHCTQPAPTPTPLPTATTPAVATPTATPEPSALRLISILPRQGVNSLPNELYIYGEGFAADDQLYLGDTLLESSYIETILSAYHGAIVPKGVTPGVYDLRIVRRDLTEQTLADAYTVLAGETVDDLSGLGSELWIDPAAPAAGLTSEIGLRVLRRGGEETLTNVAVAFYDGDPSGSGELIGNGIIASLAADSSAETTSVTWIPANTGTRDLYAVIDSADVLAESDETNNVVRREVTILSPPPEQDPPMMQTFAIDNGADFTTNQDVLLTATAADTESGVEALLYIEFAYSQNADTWLPVQNSGWIPYADATSMNWTLSARAGAKFIQAWASDAVGNISELPLEATINLVLESDHVAEGQIRIYRQSFDAGDTIAIEVESLIGDADLYVWPPTWPSEPVQFSITVDNFDALSYVAPVSGVYQIEVFGFESADYKINFNTVRAMRGLGRATVSKTAQSEPVTTTEDDPTTQQALPAPPIVEAPPSSIGTRIREMAASPTVLLWLALLTLLTLVAVRRTAPS